MQPLLIHPARSRLPQLHYSTPAPIILKSDHSGPAGQGTDSGPGGAPGACGILLLFRTALGSRGPTGPEVKGHRTATGKQVASRREQATKATCRRPSSTSFLLPPLFNSSSLRSFVFTEQRQPPAHIYPLNDTRE